MNSTGLVMFIRRHRAAKNRALNTAQGTVIHREGRVHVDVVDGEVWVGGDTRTIFTGHLPEPKRPETDQ